jgi:hypothetical protein
LTARRPLPIWSGGTRIADPGGMHAGVSKSAVYRTRAMECRKLARMAAPRTRADHERPAVAYEELSDELERLTHTSGATLRCLIGA